MWARRARAVGRCISMGPGLLCAPGSVVGLVQGWGGGMRLTSGKGVVRKEIFLLMFKEVDFEKVFFYGGGRWWVSGVGLRGGG